MKDAQIESLQAQINPHFLYNTLDCINSLADMGKTTEVKKTVTSLGSIMRMSIKGAQFLKIEEELKYVNSIFVYSENALSGTYYLSGRNTGTII